MNSLQPVSQSHRLSAVSVVSETIPGTDNVTEATRGIFESVKEWVVFFWSALVTWIKNTWNATTFLFFRAVGWISPEWSSKIETWYLYGVNFWQSYSAQSREAELQAEIAGLQVEKNAIETAAREVAGQRDQLRTENNGLRSNNEILALNNQHLSERNARLVENQTHLADVIDEARRDLQAAQSDQRLVSTQVGHMGNRINAMYEQVSALQAERDALRRQVDILVEQRQSHATPLAQAQGALSSEQSAALRRFLEPQSLNGGTYVYTS